MDTDALFESAIDRWSLGLAEDATFATGPERIRAFPVYCTHFTGSLPISMVISPDFGLSIYSDRSVWIDRAQ